ncbi:MAG: transposase [Burkholderiales bacterium]|nr:transposase [Phycisphaerae bacterium]
MKYPPARFDDVHRRAIGEGIARACAEADYVVHGCCIGYDHAHLIIARHERDIEVIIGHIKAHATRKLTEASVHPLARYIGKRGTMPTPWSQGCWKVFIDNAEQLKHAVAYVERHPEKERLARQEWAFVAPVR